MEFLINDSYSYSSSGSFNSQTFKSNRELREKVLLTLKILSNVKPDEKLQETFRLKRKVRILRIVSVGLCS